MKKIILCLATILSIFPCSGICSHKKASGTRATSKRVFGKHSPTKLASGSENFDSNACYKLDKIKKIVNEPSNIFSFFEQGRSFEESLDCAVARQMNIIISSRNQRERINKSREVILTLDPKVPEVIGEVTWPKELWAIAVVESALNENAGRAGSRGPVGLWQITKETALRLGMKTTRDNDERQDVVRSSENAISLLVQDYKKFNDWPLAILAYNRGADAVEKKMKKTKLDNATDLLRKGFKTHKDYLPKVLAVGLLLKYPKLLEL